jgi:LysM repeat protein
VSPTSEVIELSASPTVSSSEPEEAAVAPETFTPPEEESATEEPVVVDATTEDLPDGGPIAANPPASQTGDYDTPVYGDITYTVRPGDTLFSIGLRYGLAPLAIMSANNLSSDIIQAGQVLVIPAEGGSDYYPPASGSPVPGGEEQYHVVAPGETLYRIALNYGSSVDAIAGANRIPYPYLIQAGQQLIIPAYGTYPEPPPPPVGGYYQPGPGYGPESGYYPQEPEGGYYPQEPEGGYYPQEQEPVYEDYPFPDDSNYPVPGGAATHTVAPGETLYSIAQRYGFTAEAIAQANGLSNPNQIYVGQVLYLP